MRQLYPFKSPLLDCTAMFTLPFIIDSLGIKPQDLLPPRTLPASTYRDLDFMSTQQGKPGRLWRRIKLLLTQIPALLVSKALRGFAKDKARDFLQTSNQPTPLGRCMKHDGLYSSIPCYTTPLLSNGCKLPNQQQSFKIQVCTNQTDHKPQQLPGNDQFPRQAHSFANTHNTSLAADSTALDAELTLLRARGPAWEHDFKW